MKKLLYKIQKLLGIRSPYLESLGYYSCGNCERHLIQASDFEDEFVYCFRKQTYMPRWCTCKKARPIEICPFGGKDDGAHT